MITKQKYGIYFLLFLLLNLHTGCLKKNTEKISRQETTTEKTGRKKSISKVLSENDHLPIEKQIALYKKLKKEAPNAYNFENEDEMTMYGYKHLWNNELTDALAIFKLIVEEFPQSSNPYDSLGEAYLALGDTAAALENYSISLKLNPDNFNAEDAIIRIKNPNLKDITPEEKFSKTYTKQEYFDDLDELKNKLLTTHPNALKFSSELTFSNLIQEKKSLITETTTYGEFIWHCNEIIANVNCSHTTISNFFLESRMLPKDLKFPLQTLWTEQELYIINSFNNASLVNKKEVITHINDVPIAMLMEQIYNHTQSQGHITTTKKHFFNRWSSDLIAYALNFPKTYTIKTENSNETILLKPSKRINTPYATVAYPRCKNNLCLDILEDKNAAILTIASFNYYPWNNLNEFESFIDSSFKEIYAKKIDHLIIDVRVNGGGSPESSIYLLKYLTKEPFTYFNDDNPNNIITYQPFKNNYSGKKYFLIDGLGNSTTGHFMAIAKTHNLGTVIGEELGSNQFCTAGQTILRLKNTKLIYNVANATSKLTVTSLPDERGILPDYQITQGIDDYLNNNDTVKAFALSLIED